MFMSQATSRVCPDNTTLFEITFNYNTTNNPIFGTGSSSMKFFETP